MAHFAELNEQNEVLRVIVVNDSETRGKDGKESEAIGVEFCTNLLGGRWVQTSRTGKMRKLFAGVGFKYLLDVDAFQPPQPFASWSFNEDEWQWEPPVPMPADNKAYVWNEDKGAWEELA